MFQLTFSILAQLKGKLLIKCELPDDLKTETNEILGWVLTVPAAASATTWTHAPGQPRIARTCSRSAAKVAETTFPLTQFGGFVLNGF